MVFSVGGDVHVVEVRARTPVGLTAEASAAAVRAGISRLRLHPLLIDAAGKPLRCARDGLLEPTLLGGQRLVELAQGAIADTAAASLSSYARQGPVHLLLALPEPRPGFGRVESEALARTFRELFAGTPGPISVEVVPEGNAAAPRAIEISIERLASRREETCIVAAVDSYLDAETLDWLEQDRRVSRKGIRSGFVPGEAAAIVVLMNRSTRVRQRLPSLARVLTAVTGREPRSIDSEAGVLGEGLTGTMEDALRSLRLPEQQVSDLYCDINGERYRTEEWAFTLLRLSSAFRDGSDYVTGAYAWGDVGAASGALGCVLAIQAWRRRYARGSHAFIWTSAPSGLRGVVGLEQPE